MSFKGKAIKEERRNQTNSKAKPQKKRKRPWKEAFKSKHQESINTLSSDETYPPDTQTKDNQDNIKPDNSVDLPIIPFDGKTIQWIHQRRYFNVSPHEKQAFDTCLKIQSEMNKIRDMLWKIGNHINKFNQNMSPQSVGVCLGKYQTLDDRIVVCQKRLEEVNLILHPQNVWN